MLDALPAQVAILDGRARIVAVNAAWRAAAMRRGYARPGHGLGEDYVAVCAGATGPSAEGAREAAAGLLAVLDGSLDGFTCEYPCHGAGEEHWFRMTATPLVRADGRGVLVAHTEITEARAAADALRRSEARFRAIFRHEPECVKVVSLDGRLLDMNPAGLLLVEAEGIEQVRGADLSLRVHPEDRARWLAAHRTAASGSPVEITFRIQGLRGTERTLESRLVPLREQDDTIAAVLSVTRDRTERDAHEIRIAEQAALLDAAHDAIVVRDAHGAITLWNRGAERTYGWTAEQALGRSFEEVVAAEPERHAAAESALVAAGSWHGELRHLTRTGEERTEDASWTLLRDVRGAPRGVLAIHTDITERRRLEQQLFRSQRLESLGSIAGGIAHDLNNVLAPILLAVEILRRGEWDEERIDLLSIVESSARRGTDMVRQVLSFARGMDARPVLLDLSSVVQDVGRIVRDTFPKNVSFVVAAPPAVPPVSADRTQIHQVLMNLCVNARDAMPDGGTLTVRLRTCVLDETYAGFHGQARPGPHVVLTVEDTGTGIAPEHQSRLFEPFFTTKAPGQGTGLGLSTVHTIVKAHGGFVLVHSRLGKGSRFEVHLPAADPSAAPAEAPPEDPEAPPGRGELVLVVDDEPRVREVVRKTLERAGYRVELASHGAEAISRFALHRDEVAVVLTDMSMPVMDGPATILALHALAPGLPVIASSGIAAPDVVVRASAAGAIGFLPKPYPSGELLRMLRDAIANRPRRPPAG